MMGSFNASLRTIGDRRALPATITIDRGRILIVAGEQAIGDWALEEVHLEATGGAVYRMAAEGEQILIEVPDTDRFAAAIEARARMPRRPKVRTARTREPIPKVEKPKAEKVVAENPTKDLWKGHDAAPRETVPAAKAPARLDRVLAAAERRWGSLLPSWVFTRLMAGVVVISLGLTVLFPGLVSSFLLLCGLLLVLLGAIAYTDQILAARWLPGRMTAMHVLLIGVGILLLGVLVGVIA